MKPARNALLCVVLLAVASGAAAVVIAELSTGDLAAHADTIVIGKCTAGESKWEEGNLFTYTKIAVTEVLKGERRGELTVVVPGGVDLTGPVPIGQDFEGAPRIAPGEEVFLFLRRIEGIPNGFAIVGFSQGKFSIRADRTGKVVARDLLGVAFRSRQGLARPAPVTRPLSELKKEVRKLLGRSAAASPGPARKSQ